MSKHKSIARRENRRDGSQLKLFAVADARAAVALGTVWKLVMSLTNMQRVDTRYRDGDDFFFVRCGADVFQVLSMVLSQLWCD